MSKAAEAVLIWTSKRSDALAPVPGWRHPSAKRPLLPFSLPRPRAYTGLDQKCYRPAVSLAKIVKTTLSPP